MQTSAVQLERRAAQRFPFHIPVTIKVSDSQIEATGFTEDISARGAFIYTESTIAEGVGVELTLNMPSEITLGDSMRVRCRGRVLRVVHSTSGNKHGVAVHLEGYEYLPNAVENSHEEGCFSRIASLHNASFDSDENSASRRAHSQANSHWKTSRAS